MAVKIKVFGKVQGVFFRASTKDTADRLGVSGWVRNESDGTVTIVAEGNRITALIEWAKTGPQFARVDGLDVEDVPDEGYRSFDIRQ